MTDSPHGRIRPVASELEEAAHRYADTGWPVFPCVPGSKVPMTKHGYLNASTSHARIEQWWRPAPDANVAVATGAPGPDVLDVDVHSEGTGYEAFNELKRAGLVPDPKAIVRTPSGGMHAYFTGTSQRNGHLPGQHIDFRGLGGYVVAPPSTVDGRPYAVVSHQPVAATFDWAAAREHLAPAPSAAKPDAHFRDGPRSVAHLAGWLANQPEGNRNNGLFWAANRAIEAGDNATLDHLAQVAVSLGLNEREVDRTIHSAMRSPQDPFVRQPEKERELEAG
jgi:hypothetical protein